ncbi:MAG: CPBP family glutamic-type intramembrane protease, partial [Cyanobacteria bacterium P01_E01_bin.34]
MARSRRNRFAYMLLVAVFVVLAIAVFHPGTPEAEAPSSYELAIREPFNQSFFYPLYRDSNSELYRPVGDWIGRLILPEPQEYEAHSNRDRPTSSDWVWIEIYSAPSDWQVWVGQVVRLKWQDRLDRQDLIPIVSTDIRFDSEARNARRQGNIVPWRLDGRSNVGPLQSLAGARPMDDVIVALNGDAVAIDIAGDRTLSIARTPRQVPERFYGLVDILGPVSTQTRPVDFRELEKLGSLPDFNSNERCAAELFHVRHFNLQTRQFDGPDDVIRIPQKPADRYGRLPSTPQEIEQSPAGDRGWYVYGARSADDVFVVRGIQPRALVQLQPDRTIRGKREGLRYIARQNWSQVEDLKGTVQTTAIWPERRAKSGQNFWQEGDRALAIHLFGGIGGELGESTSAGTVTGHFAFGTATVVREPMADELQLAIDYVQVYAHNPNGIVSGTIAWADYMGHLQWGWLGTRPVSDVLVKLNAITQDYDFDGYRFSPLSELQWQLQVMAARYRTGDGTGVAIVTPATSCVQDSNQALYIAIEQLKSQFLDNPDIQQWLQEHPTHEQTRRFERLLQIERDLLEALAPFGTVRQDWQTNAERLQGIERYPSFIRNPQLQAAWESVGTMLPRHAHDELSSIFLQNGASLWFLRTNQVGGNDPQILPLAPTNVLGQFPIASTLLQRTIVATLKLPDWEGWLQAALICLLFMAIAVPVGLQSNLLQGTVVTSDPICLLRRALATLFHTALLNGLVFRVALLPHALERASDATWLVTAVTSTVLFVLYHPFLAMTVYPQGRPSFFRPVFLGLAAGLGLASLLAYGLTGSIWPSVALHWVVAAIWQWFSPTAARPKDKAVGHSQT